jgi:hypothetical protein
MTQIGQREAFEITSQENFQELVSRTLPSMFCGHVSIFTPGTPSHAMVMPITEN